MDFKSYLRRVPRFVWKLLIVLILLGLESLHADQVFAGISPFPVGDYWERVINGLLRDIFVLFVAYLLFLRRERIPDRLRRYFPAVVVGVAYLGFAWYMASKLRLDPYFLTAVAIPAGLLNNIVLVLLAAMFYHRNPNRFTKGVYFFAYMLSMVMLVVDVCYFWQTSMHVQSVFFRNFNWYAVKGIMASFSWKHIAALVAVLALSVALFRVERPKRSKPNFAWSILAVFGFTMLLNLLYLSCSQAGLLALHESGLWSEEQIEKSRQEYRDMLVTPVVPHIIGKAVFKKEQIMRTSTHKKKELTAEDKEWMYKLGVMRKQKPVPLEKPAYDRIVMIILESVHRDFMHHYNPAIPAEATPFLDSLLAKYPHLDNYYTSALPTTEGLNATFRSQLLFDGDVPGDDKPSLYRSAFAHGYDGYFQSASSRYYNSEFREYTSQYGMNHYEAREDMEKLGYTGASGWGFHNDEMYRRTLEQLKNLRGKKYIYAVKTLDMHQPYPYYATKWADTPASFRDEPLVTIHGMYWVDSTLKHFFEEAEKEGLMDDRTLFLITSDHNPHSGGEYEKIVKNEKDRQSIAPIPLIFVGKNLKPLAFLKEKAYASQVDLAPTLLCLLGIQPPDRFIGRNLLQHYGGTSEALGFFGNKAYYYSPGLNFVDKIDNPYPETKYEDSLANFVMYTYYRNSLPYKGEDHP